MPVFHKKRRESMAKRRIGEYLRYAIGEIILVVIGILIALQINNLNSQRKSANELNEILFLVRNDMIDDTTFIHQIIEGYSLGQPIFIKLIQSTLTVEEWDSCGYCANFGLSYAPFYFKQSGFRALDRFQASARRDSLSRELISFYSGTIEGLGDILGILGENTADNNNFLRDNYEWYSSELDFESGIRELQLNDPFYRNRMQFHYELTYNNYVSTLSQVLAWQRLAIGELNKRLIKNGLLESPTSESSEERLE
jgi:hypothetical protein